MRRLLLLVTSCLAASHPELWGEYPDLADIDNGECVPIMCVAGIPPRECTRLCSLRHYLPVCQPPGDFCLCQRLFGGSVELVSPDEVLDQPPDQESGLNIFAFILPLGTFFREGRRSAVGFIDSPVRIPPEHHEVLEPSGIISPESYDKVPDSFISSSLENSWNFVGVSEEVVVNVHEGRLYWLFRCVLTGLFLLIVALIMFEVIMCQMHNYEKLEVEKDNYQEKEEPIKSNKLKTIDIV